MRTSLLAVLIVGIGYAPGCRRESSANDSHPDASSNTGGTAGAPAGSGGSTGGNNTAGTAGVPAGVGGSTGGTLGVAGTGNAGGNSGASGTGAQPGDGASDAYYPKSCRSQCECGWGEGCFSGHCTFMGDLPNPYDFCAPAGGGNGKCACVGGTCRASDNCCVLPDGTVANSSDPACAPADL